ncbi:MAG: hypothetical protein WD602_04315 [Actinomycetota bacterium]
MPKFDAVSRARDPDRDDLPDLPPRGRGLMLLVTVSGMTALNLVFGSMIGAVIGAAIGLEDESLRTVFMAGAGLGAGAGVWFGVKMGIRFGGTSGEATQKRLFVHGLVGLVAAMVLAALVASPFVPLIAIMLPGVAAVVGDVLATRPLVVAHSIRAERARAAEEAEEAEEAERAEEMDQHE